MHIMLSTLVLVALSSQTFAGSYSVSSTAIGSGFYSTFSFQAISDPTNGRVQYVDQNTAIANNLTFTSSNSFVLRADHTNVVPSSGVGRESVRLISNAQYTTHAAVFDIRHMPQGCGTWPAVWETGANWPSGGEVDIVEGVNDQSPNRITLHTSSGCSMPSSTSQTGTTLTTTCDAYVNSNTGCSVAAPTLNSFGPSFNANGGGWYAIERTNSFIRVWFWPRNGSPPADVRSGASTINTGGWGTPTANFPSSASCNLASHFGPNNILINLTLCGDWAGAVYAADGCPGNCVDYVDNNPAAFQNAYFEFASMRVYQ